MMSTAILAAQTVSKSFKVRGNGPFSPPLQQLRAVDAVSLDISTGETLGIAGESGCGKSTFARLIAGLLQPDSGSIKFHGADIRLLDRDLYRMFRRSVQMIFQDPFSSLNPRMRIGDSIAEPLLINKLCDKQHVRSRTAVLMEQVGLSPDQYDRFPHEFSGGQRQRIGIARALAVQPTVLVADEPVSSLDISIQAQIINLLLELKQQHGLSILMISHDLGVLRHICDRIAVMYLGSVVELAPAQKLFRQCRHPYTQALLAAIPGIHDTPKDDDHAVVLPDLQSVGAQTNGCRFHPRCAYAQDICRQEQPPLLEQQPNHQVACHLSKELFPLG